MALSAFSDKAHQPSDGDVRRILGKAYESWARLIADVADGLGPIDQVWGFASAKTGWGMRIRRGKRVILYMTPQPGKFLVSFALGEKAVAAAQSCKLPPAVLHCIDEAPRYAEGRAVRIVVTRNSQVAPLAVLALVKHQN